MTEKKLFTLARRLFPEAGEFVIHTTDVKSGVRYVLYANDRMDPVAVCPRARTKFEAYEKLADVLSNKLIQRLTQDLKALRGFGVGRKVQLQLLEHQIRLLKEEL